VQKAVGVPYTIAQAAVTHVKRQKKAAKALYEQGDQVWAAFDRDQHPRFKEAVNLCKEHGVGVAQSNPCFELWLILHIEEFDRPDSRHAVQLRLSKLCKDYKPRRKTMAFNQLLANIALAEKRGMEQLERRNKEGKPNGNPSTTVGRLTAAIRDAARKARG
jgi:hypothetical protein